MDSLANKIESFVESVRMEQSNRDDRPDNEAARIRAEQAIIEAEKFKAAVATPPGRGTINVNFLTGQDNVCTPGHQTGMAEVATGGNIQQVGGVGITDAVGITDDDFFHLICHIDPALKLKIEKGEYVDLDRLLSKDRTGPWSGDQFDCERLEWVKTENGTFLMPAKRQSKINGFRRWEQAFRVYATIYCGANPHRAREIWQYIFVINTAASAFIWDNVYNYDITFRQLMQFNPGRSWAVTYSHMWNLSMRTPLPQKSNFANSSVNNFGNAGSKGSGSAGKRCKSDYCWTFNKEQKYKFSNKCKFIERCSYCDASLHGVVNCSKLDKKQNGKVEHTSSSGGDGGK